MNLFTRAQLTREEPDLELLCSHPVQRCTRLHPITGRRCDSDEGHAWGCGYYEPRLAADARRPYGGRVPFDLDPGEAYHAAPSAEEQAAALLQVEQLQADYRTAVARADAIAEADLATLREVCTQKGGDQGADPQLQLQPEGDDDQELDEELDGELQLQPEELAWDLATPPQFSAQDRERFTRSTEEALAERFGEPVPTRAEAIARAQAQALPNPMAWTRCDSCLEGARFQDLRAACDGSASLCPACWTDEDCREEELRCVEELAFTGKPWSATVEDVHCERRGAGWVAWRLPAVPFALVPSDDQELAAKPSREAYRVKLRTRKAQAAAPRTPEPDELDEDQELDEDPELELDEDQELELDEDQELRPEDLLADPRETQRRVSAELAELPLPELPQNPRRQVETLVLIACGQRKAATARPARELYTGPLTSARVAWAENTGLPWAILSGKHGPLDPGQLVEPYDVHLAKLHKEERETWGTLAWNRLSSHWGRPRRVLVHAGAAYVEALRPHLERCNVELDWLSEGKQIGEQLAQLHSLLRPAADQELQPEELDDQELDDQELADPELQPEGLDLFADFNEWLAIRAEDQAERDAIRWAQLDLAGVPFPGRLKDCPTCGSNCYRQTPNLSALWCASCHPGGIDEDAA